MSYLKERIQGKRYDKEVNKWSWTRTNIPTYVVGHFLAIT